jgi:lysophospholipid acyltransferase (LPLAT)-like uncharacterized protein
VGFCYKPELPIVGTWDKLHLPLPFARRSIVYGEPIYVPRDADDTTLAAAQEQVDDAIAHVQAEAARLIGKKPLSE